MCHIHHDPDAIIVAYNEKVVENVLNSIMNTHKEDRTPAVIRLTNLGLVFQLLIVEDVHSDSLAGQRIIKEMHSLGFCNLEFFDHKEDGFRTCLEYTLTDLETFEEKSANV